MTSDDFIQRLEALVNTLKAGAEVGSGNANSPGSETANPEPVQSAQSATDSLGFTPDEVLAIKSLLASGKQPATPQTAATPQTTNPTPPTPVTSPTPSSVAFTPGQAAAFLANYSVSK